MKTNIVFSIWFSSSPSTCSLCFSAQQRQGASNSRFPFIFCSIFWQISASCWLLVYIFHEWGAPDSRSFRACLFIRVLLVNESLQEFLNLLCSIFESAFWGYIWFEKFNTLFQVYMIAIDLLMCTACFNRTTQCFWSQWQHSSFVHIASSCHHVRRKMQNES